MRNLAPAEFNAWLGLEKIVGREDGTIAMVGREDGVSAMVSFAKRAMKAIAGDRNTAARWWRR